MEKTYKTSTREYTVTNVSVVPGHVLILGKISSTGLLVDATVVRTEKFPDYINKKKACIQPEEISSFEGNQ